MVINEQVMQDIKENAGSVRWSKGNRYVQEKRVLITNIDYYDDKNFTVSARVIGSGNIYQVDFEMENGNVIERECNCMDFENNFNYCKHIVATLIELNKHEELISDKKDYSYGTIHKVTNDTKYKDSIQLLELFKIENLKNVDDELKGKVELIPTLEFDAYMSCFQIGFRIGAKVKYKMKNIGRFCENMLDNDYCEYGKSLKFTHSLDMFTGESKKIAKFLMDYGDAMRMANAGIRYSTSYMITNGDRIMLNGVMLDKFTDIVLGSEIELEGMRGVSRLFITDEKPNIQIGITKGKKGDYKVVGKFKNCRIINGEKYSYLLDEEVLYRCSNKDFKNLFKVLSVLENQPNKEIIFSKEHISGLFSLVVPKIKDNFDFSNVIGTELEYYMPSKLSVKIYLDYNKNNSIIAKVIFSYNGIECNPYDGIKHDITRDIEEEQKCFQLFDMTGFKVDENEPQLIMKDEMKIYDFLNEGINEYMKKFEVLASEIFTAKQILKTKIKNIGVKIANNLLEISMNNLGYDTNELKEIIQSYNVKKKFYRLKDGTFVSLEDNEELDFLAKLTKGTDLDIKNLSTGQINVPISRSMYLESIMANLKNTEIKKDKQFTNLIDKVTSSSNNSLKIPKSLEDVLRIYQKDGVKWLSALDDFRFGGILADDMGLGKTLQMITLLLSYIEKTSLEERKTSLVVCPSSLTLNWRNELKRFAPKLNVLVIRGKAEERWQYIKELDRYDVIITSYDLLKRDIDEYLGLDYVFRYVVADEAQYIKNSNTKNSIALKKMNAITRYALTGTPIENSLAELWSIFDFIMPGYLYTYTKFKKNYEVPIVKEDEYYAKEALKKQIEPFILRRLKKEVLTELPDKTITIMKNEMEEIQKKAYMAYLMQAKQEITSEIDSKGFEKTQIKILALLTRLRQLCCHPGLFISNYKGESSKFIQCLEIINESIESGHKILLFSQYTSMFDFFETEFNKQEIQFFKLVGSTKIDERIKMVDEFNTNPDIKVFLISLKAGGTGLNLTGADVVIHYDPWWNLSAENQATDRAYRIGQKNNVQVYKFITENSIEEKINELQNKKANLAEDMLNVEETYVNKLSKDELMQLFED